MSALENMLHNNGYLEIEPGEYLQTQEYILAEQENWPEEDNYKNFDFTQYAYWITTECGQFPQGIDTFQDGIFTIFGVEACRKWLGE